MMKPRLLIAGLLIAPALIITLVRIAPHAGPSAASSAVSPTPPSQTAAAHPTTTSASPTADPATARAADTATSFTRAWLDPHPATRTRALKATATTDLAHELALTDPTRIPAATLDGTPAVTTSQDDTAAQARAVLSNHDILVLDLAADPDSVTGWRVTDVLPP